VYGEQLVEENNLTIPKNLEKTCPSASLSSTDFMWPDLGLNTGQLKVTVKLHLQETNEKYSGTKVLASA
jgi:hypothetical protein